MDRSTVRLINGLAYRINLLADLPTMKARLLSLLHEGGELSTRRWVVKREDGNLLVRRNPSSGTYKELPLTSFREVEGVSRTRTTLPKPLHLPTVISLELTQCVQRLRYPESR